MKNMTSQVSTKVRLVRCPKCRQLLAELPDLLLYQCGGCGTILQAKNRKKETDHTEQALQMNDAVANTRRDDGVGEKEARSSDGDLNQAGQSSLNKEHVIYEHGECSKVNCVESEDSTVEVKRPLENGELASYLGQKSIEVAEGTDGFGEFPSLSEKKESTTKDTHKLDDCSNEYIERNQHEGEESQRTIQEGGNFSVKDQNSPEVQDERNDFPRDEKPLNHLAYEDQGLSEEITQNEAESSSMEILSHEHKDSQSVELSVEVDDDTEHLSTMNSPSSEIESDAEDLHTANSPSTENESEVFIDTSTSTRIALKSPSTEELETCNNTLTRRNREELKTGHDDSTPHQVVLEKSPSTEKELKTSTNKAAPSRIHSERSTTSDDPLTPDNEHLVSHRGSVSSVDTVGNSTPADQNLELSIKNGGTVNSPTTGNYYANDDSESSYDGTDYRIRERASHPTERTIKDVDPVVIRELPVRNRFRTNNVVNSDHELNYRRPISSSILQERHSMKSRLWNENEFAQTERESGFTRLQPFHSREFTSDYRTGNPSVYRHNPLPPHPGFRSRDERPYSAPDKMELLRTVCELKDQLDRIKLPKVAPNMRYPPLNEESSHYYAQEKDIYADLNMIPDRAERSSHHRPAFSGEAAYYRHQFNCSCLDCYPRDRYHSAQLPMPSHMSSPQRYSSSEISSWGRETKFDEEQRNRDDEIKRLYLKEKYHTTRRHLRPLAGAAPVLSCYHCLEVLQLPEDFLLVDKRCHRLRCNACCKVLKLSLINRTRLVPYVSKGPAPPSEAEPVSFSDEYGRSFDRNCSTEEDASNANRKLKDSQIKHMGLRVNAESVGSSSNGMKMRKPSSEIEEERASTLHRLMGYASPRQVFEH